MDYCSVSVYFQGFLPLVTGQYRADRTAELAEGECDYSMTQMGLEPGSLWANKSYILLHSIWNFIHMYAI